MKVCHVSCIYLSVVGALQAPRRFATRKELRAEIEDLRERNALLEETVAELEGSFRRRLLAAPWVAIAQLSKPSGYCYETATTKEL